MSEPWNLEWFYFSDIECLIRGLCDQTVLLHQLIEMEDPNEELRSYHGKTPALITRIRGIANAKRSNDAYAWAKPWPFEKLLIRRDVPDTEILITPTMVVLPFPFPIKDEDLTNRFEQNVVSKVLDNIPFFDQNELDAPVLCARSVLLVVDKLIEVEIERDKLNWNLDKRLAIMDYEGNRYNGPRSWENFEIPEDKDKFEIHADTERPGNQTQLSVDPAAKMHFHIGIKIPDRPTYEPHPGGAFDSDCTEV